MLKCSNYFTIKLAGKVSGYLRFRVRMFPESPSGCSGIRTLVVPSTHPLAHKREIRLSEFINERFISPQEDEAMYSICQNACMEAKFKPNIICTVNNSSIRLKMIEAGLGVGFFPQEDKMEYLNEKVIWLNPDPCE